MNGILSPDCAESTIRRRLYVPASAVQRHLTTSTPGLDERTRLYGALMSALVWVSECEVGLAEDGPFLELRPLQTVVGRLLAIYTSRDRIPGGPDAAEPVAFAELIGELDPDVTILVDPIEVALPIPPADLRLLVEIADEGF